MFADPLSFWREVARRIDIDHKVPRWKCIYKGREDILLSNWSKTGHMAPSWPGFDKRIWTWDNLVLTLIPLGRSKSSGKYSKSSGYRVTLTRTDGAVLAIVEGTSWQVLVNQMKKAACHLHGSS